MLSIIISEFVRTRREFDTDSEISVAAGLQQQNL